MSSGNLLFAATYNQQDLWRPMLIEEIANQLPQRWLARSDLLLLLVEIIANAAIHGQAERLEVTARQRGTLALLNFRQDKPMQTEARAALAALRRGAVPASLLDCPYGLGFRIVTRLARHVTMSVDGQNLQVWLKEDRNWTALVMQEAAG
jgi:hypothetical protein